MKALEKDRTRRYETANGLAMDVQRYLSNEPIVARPPSNLYRFRKLVRRNRRTLVSATAILVLALISRTIGLAANKGTRKGAPGQKRLWQSSSCNRRRGRTAKKCNSTPR